MKTIHIKGINLKDNNLKQWYKDFLKDDPKFHYVYWENMSTHKAFIEGKNILIRLEDKKVIKKLETSLKDWHFLYEIYDYPYTKKKFQLGLFKKSWEDRYLNISQQLDHVCSVAALELNTNDWYKFIQQLFHIACNTKGYDHYMQTKIMFWLLNNSLETYHLAIKDMLKNLNKYAKEKKT